MKNLIFHAAVTFLTKGYTYRDVGKSLARPGRKQATAPEDFECQLQPADRSHMITHQQTSPILPQTRSRYIPPTPPTQ